MATSSESALMNMVDGEHESSCFGGLERPRCTSLERMEGAFIRFLESTARREALAECLGAWRRTAEDSRRQRGDAMFDAMGEQMQSAQFKSQILDCRCKYLCESWHLQEAGFLICAVISAWRSRVLLRRTKRIFGAALDFPAIDSNTVRIAFAFTSWRCEVLDAALLRLRGSEVLDAALLDCTGISSLIGCNPEQAEEDDSRHLGSVMPEDDDDDVRSAGNTGFIHRHGPFSCTESIAFSDMTAIKMNEDDSDHPGLLSCARKLSFTAEKAAQHSSRTLIQSQSVEFLLSGVRKDPAATTTTAVTDKSVSRGGMIRSSSLTLRTQSQQPACQNVRQGSGVPGSCDKSSEGSALIRPQRRTPFAPCQEIASPSAQTSEPKRLKGPERFFYDTSSYTGCARFGGPTVVDKKENRGMNVDAMPKRGGPNMPSSGPPSASPGVADSLRSTASHVPLR
mmetsp:Transcript_82833/g.130512  ORF Transcript_82833/g.130512 Transcript_82833/m.130512 type:complete len:453 (-) Transcript_82833:72-1430(-)